ncbi:CoA-binding protein [Pseudovibrio japonicus]|uniref:CoA-binding protein n=1 Tax=Pseudovibrio japonicus TaxID=366534 RepID=A0ABQ3EEY7_9HYPH|nr:CoA-binding protein [Pseudovibrio japonicus]GHB36425.1 CoA-binding protein [Pseudovibrio japonicus]
MNHNHYSDGYIRDILKSSKTIALVGASNKPERASFRVLNFLLENGYDVYPINPGQAGNEIAGRKVYASLNDLPAPVDMVEVFRNSEAAGGVIDETLTLTTLPDVIWLQLGVRNDKAAARAEAKGIKVVMDRCPKIEIPRLAALGAS